jgi:hypothetical protein
MEWTKRQGKVDKITGSQSKENDGIIEPHFPDKHP